MPEHVILVAFSVEAPTREGAETVLLNELPRPGTERVINLALPSDARIATIWSWWVAEDDRRDGSDNDSAVFVTPGNQHAASSLLHAAGMTPAHNVIA